MGGRTDGLLRDFATTTCSNRSMPPSMPVGVPEDLDAAYPETAGYSDFVDTYSAVLEKLASLTQVEPTERLLRENLELMEQSAHTGVRATRSQLCRRALAGYV